MSHFVCPSCGHESGYLRTWRRRRAGPGDGRSVPRTSADLRADSRSAATRAAIVLAEPDSPAARAFMAGRGAGRGPGLHCQLLARDSADAGPLSGTWRKFGLMTPRLESCPMEGCRALSLSRSCSCAALCDGGPRWPDRRRCRSVPPHSDRARRRSHRHDQGRRRAGREGRAGLGDDGKCIEEAAAAVGIRPPRSAKRASRSVAQRRRYCLFGQHSRRTPAATW